MGSRHGSLMMRYTPPSSTQGRVSSPWQVASPFIPGPVRHANCHCHCLLQCLQRVWVCLSVKQLVICTMILCGMPEGAGENMNASQFYFTLDSNLDSLDEKHTIFGEVTTCPPIS